MYEGHIKGADLREQGEGEDLRRFRWTDLVAKIAATRDLRGEFERVGEGLNTFADLLREGDADGKPTFNHTDLSRGKTDDVSLGKAANDAAQGDRE